MIREIVIILILFGVFSANGQGYKVSRVNLGAKGVSQICPVKYNDGIVFMSNKRAQILNTIRDETGQLPYNLYYRKISDKKASGEDAVFARELATKFNDGPVSFSDNGKQVFYSRNIDLGQVTDSGRARTLGIFLSSKSGDNNWTDPVPFVHNNENYNVSHPATDASGRILVFSSTMPGGHGGADLYICTRDKNGNWSTPENLGPQINSPGNEMFPSLHRGKWLFFSSDGRNGMGGLDIYISKWNEAEKRYDTSTGLDTDINSDADDFGITLNQDGLSGYFGSSRTGKDEIYYFEKTLPDFKDCAESRAVNYCYLIRENNIMEEDGLPLKFEWDLGDGTKGFGLEVPHCYSDTGSYVATLNIIDTTTQEIYYEVSQVAINIQLENRPYIVGADSVIVGEKAVYEINSHALKPRAVEVFWKLDDGRNLMTDKIEREFSSAGEYQIQLGILDTEGSFKCVTRTITVVPPGTYISSGASENKGPTDFPENMSYAVELLNSIKKKALNDPVFDKVNYPITARFNEVDSVYQYTVGETDKVASLYQLYKEMKGLGFESKVVSFESNKVSSDGVSEVLIFFAPGKDKITGYNEVNLNNFVTVLTKSSQLEVLGYADPTGNPEFNKQLSLQRAKKVADYLEGKGIPRANITIKALGAIQESSSDEEILKFYRKVEVKLLPE